MDNSYTPKNMLSPITILKILHKLEIVNSSRNLSDNDFGRRSNYDSLNLFAQILSS